MNRLCKSALSLVAILIFATGAMAQAPTPPAAVSVPAPAAPASDAVEDAQSALSGTRAISAVIGVPATFQNAVKAAIKQNALDLSSDDAIDDFARIEYCDIYKQYHSNEFDWRRVRAAMRKKIELDKPTYPDTLYLERQEQFTEYDFASGMLPLQKDSVLHTRALKIAQASQGDMCGTRELLSIPPIFVAYLEKPLVMDGIELSEDEARTVVAGMDTAVGNPALRIAYGRYTITLTGDEPDKSPREARVDARLDDVTMYLDSDYSRPFWSGQSSAKVYHQQSKTFDLIPFKGIDSTDTQAPTLTPQAPPGATQKQ